MVPHKKIVIKMFLYFKQNIRGCNIMRQPVSPLIEDKKYN